MEEKIKVRNLKAYLVRFSFENKEYADEFDYHVITVIAHDPAEANAIFIKFALAKKLNIKVSEMSIVPQRKSKSNKHMINKEFYIKQNDFVNNLYEKFKKGEKN